MTDQTNPVETIPALGISLRFALGGGEVVFQTHIAQDAAASAMNALFDRVMKAAQRQQAKLELVQLEKSLKQNVDQLERMREDRKRVEQQLTDAQNQPGRRLTGKDQSTLNMQRSQADANEKRMEEMVRDVQDEISKTKALAEAED